MPNLDCFPLKSRVVLHGLVKAPELNGKIGVVTSALNNGRQSVQLELESKTVGLKPANLKFEGRSVDSLSIKELKKVLLSKNVEEAEVTGIDKAELKSKVADLVESPEEVAELLAVKSAAPASASAATSTKNLYQAADEFANMDPDQLRQQARAMKSMDPAQIRRMNPQLAHMTDQQIRMAADQMEMMANNPHMMQMAKEQVSNMSPEELERVKNGGVPNAPSGPTYTPSPNGTATPNPQQAAQMMADMSPEQLRQQAHMLKTMEPDAIRRMNPQLAHMTDEQIKMAATQFEMMAQNPEMVKMAQDQMKNMTPEQMEQMKSGNGGQMGMDMSSMGGDPSKMMANMDKDQLRQMMSSIKENPEMLKQFAAMSGISEEQLAQGVEMFAGMDDSKLDMALGTMQKVQKAKDLWTDTDTKTGGHLKKIVIASAVLFVGLLIKVIFFRGSGAAVASTTVPEVPIVKMSVVAPDEEDEFGSEF
mmetsp:Transcript_104588/g.156640  ORF Transcript_104588/g.156640 Transcript_104588/m.156640 type:complete len:477 (-) Transcript_104588:1015-2445(-)|eukprot:CAMPEP_0117004328 /NCGR_PEP_ID=MMETSP0472-20121206/5342_1 /TAXON_ID=693140 ORGANISM="Tiarina fusus, Strain LIS" /NCGR_SAMPLE_ID=MMETSP0472 /ASSEMBLY_ACC=CAM_ASM_000603 /LENGTH=476 /DNA_ID=CAMNT_0004705255 /DNA_START=110 /DNA_END=1540 /DNA_ORIENTATION=-